MNKIKWFLGLTFLLTYLTHGLLAYLISQNIIGFYHIGGILLYSIGGFSPTLFAIILIIKYANPQEKRTFLQKLLSYKHHLFLWLFAVFMPFILGVVFLYSDALHKGIDTTWANPWTMFFYFFIYSIAVGGLEEIGWRGYLQNYLNGKFHLVFVALLVGLIWASWHIPLLMIGNPDKSFLDLMPYFLGLMMFNVYMTYLYAKTKSILLTILFHASVNATRRITGFRILLEQSFFTYLMIGLSLTIGLLLLFSYQHKLSTSKNETSSV